MYSVLLFPGLEDQPCGSTLYLLQQWQCRLMYIVLYVLYFRPFLLHVFHCHPKSFFKFKTKTTTVRCIFASSLVIKATKLTLKSFQFQTFQVLGRQGSLLPRPNILHPRSSVYLGLTVSLDIGAKTFQRCGKLFSLCDSVNIAVVRMSANPFIVQFVQIISLYSINIESSIFSQQVYIESIFLSV